MKSGLRFGLLWLLFISTIGINSQTPAFPGAEGHGMFTSGGRGGQTYFVNNLSDLNTGNATTHEGSLRWCLNQNGKKTILFKVSGTIFLSSSLTISKGNLTIAGQSAPGDGICVAGHPVFISASNVIIRYMRFRMGDGLEVNADGADALGSRKTSNIIIDHCSMSWSTDECVSIYENENTTLQWCIISESLRLSSHTKGAHGYGGIWGGFKASFHHNLMANNDSRTPRFGPGTSTQLTELTDMRNCVIYNWTGNGCYGGEAMRVNIVNNYYKPGLGSPSGSKRARIVAIDKKTNLATTDGFYAINNKWGKFYIAGNVVDASTSTGSNASYCNSATADNWNYGVFNQFASGYGTVTQAEKDTIRVNTPFDSKNVTTHSAAKAYQKVLNYAGASLHRDSQDERIINETSNGTSTFTGLSAANVSPYPKPGIIDNQMDLKPAGADSTWSPWPALQTYSMITDENADGIADEWLNSNFPGKAAEAIHESGYTYLEIYLNSLVNQITVEQNKESLTTSIQQIDEKDQMLTTSVLDQELKYQSATPLKSLELFSINGMKISIYQLSGFEGTVALNHIPKGMYIARFYPENTYQPIIRKILNT